MATENDKVNTGALATLVAVGVFATLAVALGVDALVRFESSKVQADRAGHAETQVRDLVREQRAQLQAQPMPIERAMAAVVLDLRQNPWSATPPAPEKDAGVDAAIEATDAGADAAAAETEDGGAPLPEGVVPPPGDPKGPIPVPVVPATPPAQPKVPTVPPETAPTVKAPAPAPTVKAPAPAPTAAVAPKPTTPAAPPAAPAAPATPAPKPTDG